MEKLLSSIDNTCRLIFDGMNTVVESAEEAENKAGEALQGLARLDEKVTSMSQDLSAIVKQAVAEQFEKLNVRQILNDQLKESLRGAHSAIKTFTNDINNIIPECIANINEKMSDVISEQRDNLYTDIRLDIEADYKRQQQTTTGIVTEMSARFSALEERVATALDAKSLAAKTPQIEYAPPNKSNAPNIDVSDILANIPNIVADTIERISLHSDLVSAGGGESNGESAHICMHDKPAKSSRRSVAGRKSRCELKTWIGMPYCWMHIHLHADTDEVRKREDYVLMNSDYRRRVINLYKDRIKAKNDCDKTSRDKYFEYLYMKIMHRESALTIKRSCATQTAQTDIESKAAASPVAARHRKHSTDSTDSTDSMNSMNSATSISDSSNSSNSSNSNSTDETTQFLAPLPPREYDYTKPIDSLDTEDGKYKIVRSHGGLPICRLPTNPYAIKYDLKHMLSYLDNIKISGIPSARIISMRANELKALCCLNYEYNERRDAELASVLNWTDWNARGNLHTYDFNDDFVVPDELPNARALSAPVDRFTQKQFTEESELTYSIEDPLHEDMFFKKMYSFDTIEGAQIRSPLSKKNIELLISQTNKYKARNVGLILELNGRDQYNKFREVSSIHNQLGVYKRRILNIKRTDKNVFMMHGNVNYNMVMCRNSARAYNNALVRPDVMANEELKNAYTLRYNNCGFLYDAITGYIFYPTKCGTVCIGVAYIDTVCAHEKKLDGSRVKYKVQSNLTTHVGMLNKFEVAHCISLKLNFLCPDTGKVVYYNKIDENTDTVVYNRNYYKYNPVDPATWFVAQTEPPSPIDPELTIPPTLYTKANNMFAIAGETTIDPLNPAPFLRNTTGTGCTRLDDGCDNYDPATRAVQYLRIPNMWYSLGQLKKNDEIEKSQMAQVPHFVSRKDAFNDELIGKRPLLENYDASHLMQRNDRCTNYAQCDMVERVIPETQHLHMIDLTDAGYIIDPFNKYIMTIKGGANICVGEFVKGRKLSREIALGSMKQKVDFDVIQLSGDDIKVCINRQMNYLDPNTNKIVYYSYYDTRINRIVYNLNYYRSSNCCILPSFQPPASTGQVAPDNRKIYGMGSLNKSAAELANITVY